MELKEATLALAALAQPSRLEVFRLLVRSGKHCCAGDIARELGLPKSTLSFHLKELVNAGLVESSRDGRSILYQVDAHGIRELLAFLTEDCCGSRPELCLPFAEKCIPQART